MRLGGLPRVTLAAGNSVKIRLTCEAKLEAIFKARLDLGFASFHEDEKTIFSRRHRL